MLKCQIISPLNKVFCDGIKNPCPLKKISALRGEKISFQIFFYIDSGWGAEIKLAVKEGPLSKALKMKLVRSIPVQSIKLSDDPNDPCRSWYERTTPGLYPDWLTEYPSPFQVPPRCYTAVWCELTVPTRMAAGSYPLGFTVQMDKIKKNLSLNIDIADALLPKQTLKSTGWFYCDCIAMAYKQKPWTPGFWKILEKFFLDFTSHGLNMLLTPVFTPPLDTEIGGERLTTQLVRVKRIKKVWHFDFRDLRKWVALAEKCGIRYFEISHLFTQWGAAATPKIIATVDGVEKRVFGWDVSSDSAEWDGFLHAFLPALKKELVKLGIYERTSFHASDEPLPENMENYKRVVTILKRNLPDIKIMDALSHTEFFEKGLCPNPVPSIAALEKFIKLPVPERWTYYCCGPLFPYPNRIMPMPASANRILGTLLYIYEVKGFLHWGYNFWNLGRTGKYAPPGTVWQDTFYPEGDTCLVYPGLEGPENSMREEVFFAGLQDQRALQLLEKKTSRKTVLDLIRKTADGKLPVANDFPRDPAFFHKLRESINAMLAKAKK